MTLLSIFIGGGLGALLRSQVTQWCQKHFHSRYPIATLCVNIIGAFALGVVMAFAMEQNVLHAFIITGLLGGLTTFSTLSLELIHFLTPQLKLKQFMIYTLLQFVVGFIACFIGFQLI